MNKKTKTRHFPILLDCDHTVYFAVGKPRPGDVVYCRTCVEYRGVDKNLTGAEVIEDGYTRTLVGSNHRGVCNECEHEVTKSSIKVLRQTMFKHVAIVHGASTILKYEDEHLVPLPSDTPPF